MNDASVARANGRHRRRGSVAFGSVRRRFGSVPNRSLDRHSTSDSIASNCDRRSNHPEGRPFGIETEDASVDANANERGERRER